MTINRRSVNIMASSGSEMNKYSEVAKGDSYYGYTDGLHTVQVIYNQFVGRVHVQGTLSLDPQASDWFDIIPEIVTGNSFSNSGYIEFATATTKSEAYTFKGNFTFVRVYLDRTYLNDGVTYDSSYGQISQVILSS